MKTKFYSLFAILALSVTAWSQGIGINNTGADPHPSAMLDVASPNKGLLLPRVANTAAIASPTDGLMIFDLSAQCVKLYQDGAWSDCIGAVNQQIQVVCFGPPDLGFLGNYVPGGAHNADGATRIKVRIINEAFFQASFTPSISNIALSGAPGLTVASVSPNTSTNIPGGGFLDVTYTFGGTVPSSGVVTATWSGLGLSCSTTLDLNPSFYYEKDILNTCTISPIITPGSSFDFWQIAAGSGFTINSSNGNLTGTSNTTINGVGIRARVSGTHYYISRLNITAATAKVITLSTAGSSTVNKPAGVTSFTAEVWGGGGGGSQVGSVSYLCGIFAGCCYAGAAMGGNGGDYAIHTFSASPPSATINYTVGGGGSGSTSGNLGQAGNGGLSSVIFNSQTLQANGGRGGLGGQNQSCTSSFPSGSNSANDDLSTVGTLQKGQQGQWSRGNNNNLSRGGGSPNGGAQLTTGERSFGQGGNAPGGGGTGGTWWDSSGYLQSVGYGNISGGNGATGRVIIEFACP